MTQILVVAEFAEGAVRPSTLSAISFARKASELSAGKFAIAVIGGPGTAEAAQQLTSYGADKVLYLEHPELTNYVAERFAPSVINAARGFDIVCATASSFGKDLIPRVAAALDAGYAADCADVLYEDGRLVYKRPMYAGNAYGFVALTTPVSAVTVRQSEFAAAAPSSGESAIEALEFKEPSGAAAKVEFVSLDQVKSERPELTEAKTVISGGRALKERFFEVLEPLAEQLGAAIGASRAACDAGYAPGDYQVGQTGKIVAPQLYFAVGISGAIQHIAGMKGSKTIVAINNDPDAPIFQVADYGLVADLFEAVPQLVDALKARA